MHENNDAATKRRDDGATRQRIDVATRQRSNAATEQRGNAATDWRGDAATEQRGNAATDWVGFVEWKFVKELNAKKKSAWTDLDRVSFQKICQRVKCRNQKIGVDWSRQSQKRPLQRQVSLMFSSRLVTWGSLKRSALRWPALDKRCSSCYTLRGCGFADIQSREEFTDALAS